MWRRPRACRCGAAGCSSPAWAGRTTSRSPRCPISSCRAMCRPANATGRAMLSCRRWRRRRRALSAFRAKPDLATPSTATTSGRLPSGRSPPVERRRGTLRPHLPDGGVLVGQLHCGEDRATRAFAAVAGGAADWLRGRDDVAVVCVGAGFHHSLAVTGNGSVVAWGWNPAGQTSVPAGLSNAVAVAGGQLHSMGLTAEGKVICWGWDPYGTYPQVVTPQGLPPATAIGAGGYYG